MRLTEYGCSFPDNGERKPLVFFPYFRMILIPHTELYFSAFATAHIHPDGRDPRTGQIINS